ncbi:MAG: DUF2442 domain-containing protein [Chlamydiae bacterium]|nr:DUF2442 domain-containing protein [Chlamydiota bacterium]MBI3277957.1 DUF2442 domain-containing protein [Chlamydiota bacterium]
MKYQFYRNRVRFKNGQLRLFDVKPYLNKGIFKELKNESYFKKVRIVWGGIGWPNEQDLSSDTLYYGGLPSKKKVKICLS